MNQKDIRKQCEQIWARNKYYVLSKSHKVYLEIREYLKESEVELEVLLQKINKVNELQENKKDFHMYCTPKVRHEKSNFWGVF